MAVMLFLSSACAVKCDLLNPNACGLYDCGGNSWSPDETVGNGDNLSLRSGQVNMIGSSKVCMKVTGPGLVRFVWRVDPTAQHVGMLSFWVDDTQAAVCNSQGWSPISYSLREGKDYELAWQFLKTQSYPEGAGAGWIDDLDVLGADYSPFQYSGNWNNGSGRNETFNSAKMTDTLVSNGPIFVNPPNITINIGVYNRTNFSVNILNSGVNVAPTLPQPRNLSACVCQNNSTRPGYYERISDAVNAVGNGGTVTVDAGSYNESVVIDKGLHLVGESNTTTKIVVQDRDGIVVSCIGKNVSIENLSIINNYSSCKKAIGVNVSSENLNVEIRNCNILNFAFGVKISKSRKLSVVGNKIISSIEFDNPDNENQLCTRYNRSISGNNFTVGLWFQSSCGAFNIHDNIIELKNDTNPGLYTYGIVHKG
ncbi:MAG: hypothetical protein WBN94_06280, partial [Methanothrix sp.]